MEDELDFFSLAFNPLRALSAPGLRPPVANARPLDNLHQCRRLLSPDHPSYLPPRDTAATTDLVSPSIYYLKELHLDILLCIEL